MTEHHLLTSLLDRLPSLDNPNNYATAYIHHHKARFSDPNTLQRHLGRLGVPELADYIVWISPNRFTNVHFFDEGGFAKVYKGTIATDIENVKEHFALKELNGRMEELVLNVCLTANGVGATVPLIGLSQHPTTHRYLMVFEFAPHGTLESAILDNSHDWHLIARLFSRLAHRLADLHAFGYAHHDLHPGNIIFKSSHHPLLIDLGLATPFNEPVAQSGHCGRSEYLPPEFFANTSQTSAEDVYCLATVFWHYTTGVPPKGDASTAIVGNPDGLRERMIPESPPEFAALLRECWQPDPHSRPSMQEVYERLKKWRKSFKGISMPFSPRTVAFITELRVELEKELVPRGSLSGFKEIRLIEHIMTVSISPAPFFFDFGIWTHKALCHYVLN